MPADLDYLAVARRALTWTVRHRREFQLPAPEDPRFVALLKPLGELALTARVLAAASYVPPTVVSDASNLLLWCWEELERGELLRSVVLDQPELVVLAAIYPCFRDAGLCHEGFESGLATVVKANAVARLEYPAWRRLELAVTFEALGIDGPWDADEAYEATWLAGRPEPWYLGEGAAYSVTHTVFYRTAFGDHAGAIPARDRSYIVRWLPVWVEHYAQTGNFDLVAELIMVARCLQAPDEGTWDALLRSAQDEDGLVAGPATQAGGLEPAVRSPARRRFLDNYHTTLVALMAAGMSLDPHAVSASSSAR